MRKAAAIVILWGVLSTASCSFRQDMPFLNDVPMGEGEMKGTWRGGVADKPPHTVRGADLRQISFRGSHEAAAFAHAVEYRSGKILYRADILSRDTSGECTSLHEQVWEEGVLVRTWLRKVCQGEKYDPGAGE